MATTNILLESGTNELEIVEFFIEEEDPKTGETYKGYYGVNVAKVLEIIRQPEITEMPNSPDPSVLGAFNHRSHVIPLIDLSIWLGKNREDNNDANVIVTEFNEITSSFLVSGVTRIHRLSWQQVEPPDAYVAKYSGNSITGVVRLEDRIVFILDLEKIVTDLNPDLGLKLDLSDAGVDGRELKALVADDSAMIRHMIKDLMEKAHFLVETQNTGQHAWDRLQELKQKSVDEDRPITDFIHVLISDIEMPSMDGHNLTKRVKEDPVLRKLPVILFSSLISDKQRHKGESVGADDQVTKPEVGTLARRSRELIEQYHGISSTE